MQDAKADMPEADQAAFHAMLAGWQGELARVGGEWGQMPAASAMLFVALKGLKAEVGDEALAALLEAVAGSALVARAYEHALRERYLWHEFGDSCLLLPG